MKKIYILIIAIFTISFANAQSLQSKSVQTQTGWTTDNPFKTDVFVENYGQFDTWAKSSSPILYAVNNSDKIFFTKQGVIFKLQKIEQLSEEQREHHEKKSDKEKQMETKFFFVYMNWENCNPNPEIIANEISEGYYTFGEKGYENIKAQGYKRLTYKNIYQNIDVEYIIPENGGIKYSIILHPGADESKIKMNYSGNVEKIIKDKQGNIIIETPAGVITDHSPESYYEADLKQISTAFQLNASTVCFQLSGSNSSDKSQNIIIDPWTTTPTSLLTNNTALDIDHDGYGNVYFSGGSTPYKLSKYSDSGVFLWTFTNPLNWCTLANVYSKFCLLLNSGTVFIGEGYTGSNPGSRVMKIGNNGILSNTSPYFGINNEIWKMFYNNCSKQLIAFGGGTKYNHNIKVIADTNLSISVSKNFNGYTNYYNDIASVVMDNNGDFYALMTTGSNNQLEGKLQKCLFSTNYSLPLAFDVQTTYQFEEGGTGLAGVNGSVLTIRANALALNNNYLFSYDGKTLKAWNKINGNLLSSIIVDPNYIGGRYRVHEGIDVDECNNVYVGGSTKVHIFTFTGSSFISINPITTNITNEVHDIKLNKINGKLYICGVGFVTDVIAPLPCVNSSTGMTVTASVSDSCFGRACVSVSGGIPPYNYLWSNGSTDSCIIGVPAGTYTVIVSDNSCSLSNYYIDTIVINPALQLSVHPYNPLICSGDSVTFTASSSNFGTSFHWSNGVYGNNITVSPIITTTYTVTANNYLCSDTIPVKVIINNSHSVLYPTICYGKSYKVGLHTYLSTGVYNDTLTSFIGCDSIIITHLTVRHLNQNITNPVICQGNFIQVGTHVYTSPGIYFDTLQSTLGCDSIIITHLTVSTESKTTINPVICQGEIFHSVFGNYSLPGIYYEVLLSTSGCDSLIEIKLTLKPLPEIYLGNDSSMCKGSTITLYANYPNTTYLWQDNSINPIFNVTQQGLYWVKVTLDSCSSKDSIYIYTFDCHAILELPNIITPNNDSSNDIFLPLQSKNIEKMNTQLFNRWGNMIYETDNLQIEWDGKSKGQLVADGVYFWIVNYTDTNGKEGMMKGSVTVMK
jgi:gliding motility-associated-like protein